MFSKQRLAEWRRNQLLHSRAMYLCYFMALGAFLPFINLYYQRLGLTGVQIGILSAVPPLVMSTASILWGAIADALRLHRRILQIALLLSAGATYMLSLVNRFGLLIFIVLIAAFFSASISPLLDSAALESAESKRSTYGGLRVWGTLGWTISTWLVGALIEQFNIRWLFYSFVFFMGLSFVASLLQPARSQVLRTPFLQGFGRLVSQPVLLPFLASMLFVAAAMGAVNYFFSIYLDEMGAGEGTIGLAWALAAASEVPVMIYAGRMMDRLGAGGLLKVAFVTYALRWLLYSFVDTPGSALVVQLLHGLSFGAFLVGGVSYTSERTPEGLGTTGQSLFGSVSFGLGPIAGGLIGGYFYDTVGMDTLFRILSLVTIAGLGLFWRANNRHPAVERLAA